MTLTIAGLVLLAVPLVLFAYAYLIYPLVLRFIAALRPAPPTLADPLDWPSISICLPAYNEERSIRDTLEALLRMDYPADRRQILVVSDASTDATDDIVREFAGRGVELLRLPARAGKTAAENAAAAHLRGEIVVNTDATIRIPPGSLKPLVRVFQDPTIGVASGRDVSVGRKDQEANRGESGYVGYEMWLRSLETRVGSIVGASGCFYAIRRPLVNALFPEALTRFENKRLPLPLAAAGFFVAVNVAALAAWWKALRGERNPIWEPTRRPGDASTSGTG